MGTGGRKERAMAERVSFGINAELYEDQFGDLAMRLPGDYVYRDVGEEEGAEFVHEAVRAVVEKELPATWQSMAPHELLYGRGWHCIISLGFIDGDIELPGVEFESDPQDFGGKAQRYLREVLPDLNRRQSRAQ